MKYTLRRCKGGGNVAEKCRRRSISRAYYFRYYSRDDAVDAVRYINGTRLDDRIIRTDWDAGFIEGRQFGRGKHGGQASHFWL